MATEPRFAIQIPDAQRAGVFADFVSIWHTQESFVLDFAALVQPMVSVEEAGEQIYEGQAEVVSRVRVPPGQVFEIMRALEQQLTQWEAMTGRRSTPPEEAE